MNVVVKSFDAVLPKKEQVTQSMDPADESPWYWHIADERPYKLVARGEGKIFILEGENGQSFLAHHNEVVHIKSQIFLSI